MKDFMDFLKTNKKRLLRIVVISLVIMLVIGWALNIITVEYVIGIIIGAVMVVIILYENEKKRS